MSSTMRDSVRAEAEALSNGIVRRMVSLPRNILGGLSRVMNQGIDNLIGLRERTNQNHYNQTPNFHFQQPFNQPQIIQEEWAFLSNFEQHYGTTHPFFYACRFVDALKIAEDEHKFMFMYVHSPEHPFTPSFCRETLCTEVVVQFLDSNFVCWGALANRGEGSHMVTTLGVSTFPFCAVVAPSSGDNLAILQQMEGPVSPAELVEILQSTIEQQGLAFGSGKAKQEDKRRANLRLKEEQDAAYLAALKIDQVHFQLFFVEEKERHVKKNSENKKPEKSKQNPVSKQPSKSTESSQKAASRGCKKAEETKILIRFQNGERREQSFLCTDKIKEIYRYIDSLGLVGVGNYRLISNFPRKVYGSDQMEKTLKDAGFHPKSSLFLEFLD
ncbi:hypothetical protein RD792_014868 [Penstemon davidsonii]|uniref:UBX domain-containing protein n=1 Tax=Penstemon davidsonii TaxID=160366 RepID=A0ABR0CQH0_9LAMI|nr:hypothetical protein RD792_014868 [Penstemon davidsonii]